jgi:hypothetical protein
MAVQNSITTYSPHRTFTALRRLARPQLPKLERCELCGIELPATHDHLVEPKTRKLLCTCQACGLLFCGQAEMKYRRVPRDARFVSDFCVSEAEWNGLMIPINMAFFFYDSLEKRMAAIYPSPAGPVESLLTLESWNELARDHAVVSSMEPDVEALLVNRMGESYGFPQEEYYIAPIDHCYRLVGLLRLHWRGLSGGTEAWAAIRQFFDELKRGSHTVQEESHE